MSCSSEPQKVIEKWKEYDECTGMIHSYKTVETIFDRERRTIESFVDDEIVKLTPYFKGKIHGSLLQYEDGKVVSSIPFVDGKVHGFMKSYREGTTSSAGFATVYPLANADSGSMRRPFVPKTPRSRIL
ncbi:hypothetical protein D1R32_gp273 [Tunisvirus fontaine2]|uniref:MORN repeat-containing protein n=1 Tax=Tunisvirus fontaine2 TaxID=1421067 RepID=V9SE24_9VIRU|nr:hypothetical protein D1R32_gp273 [Tunisvirus fontaine2]AHC54990.1 hypothetical protein TNS_ORF272 [Tunisvirus fontaine2]